MKSALVAVSALLAALGARSGQSAILQTRSPTAIQVDKVKDNLYALRGGGGNTAAFVTTNGVVLVDTKLPGWGKPILKDVFKENNGRGLPRRAFKDRMTLGRGNERVELYYFGRAHTGGDAWGVFPALGVLHSGDAFAVKSIPLIDANNGGVGSSTRKQLQKPPPCPTLIPLSRGAIRQR